MADQAETGSRRVAVLTNEALGFGGGTANGFGQRYANVVGAIAQLGHESLVVSLGARRSQDPRPWPEGELNGARYTPLDWSPSRSKVHSFVDVSRSVVLARTAVGPGRDWERAVRAELAAFAPDVVLVLAPFRPSLCLLVGRSTPVVYFAEEDLSRLGPSRGMTHIRRQLTMTRVRAPDVVVVISEDERRWAESRWARRPVVVVPHGIDVDHWSCAVTPEPTLTDSVFTIGNYGNRRNADGLSAVVDELERRDLDAPVTIAVASAAPLKARPSRAIRELGEIDDPRRCYAGARLALVPSFDVTGVKTQILQAWAAGCPVVTTSAAARSVLGVDGRDLAAGSAPADVVDRLQRLLADPDEGTRIADEGRRSVRARFSLDALTAGVDAALRAAC